MVGFDTRSFGRAVSGWTEGATCGRTGAGLAWKQLDCNGDRRVDLADRACSAFVPDFANPLARVGSVRSGKRVSVDLSDAFLGGQSFYSLAIRNDSANGAKFASSEHRKRTLRPRLEVVELLNDECDAPVVVGSTPFQDVLDTRRAGTSDGDPPQSCTFPTAQPNSVWYAYAAAADGTVTVDTAGSDYDTTVSVHTGACNPIDHMLTEVACQDDGPGGSQARASFPVVAGTTYLILVTDGSGGFNPGGGTLRLALDFAPAP